MLSLFGCTGNGEKTKSQIPTNQAWAILKSNYDSLLETKKAKDDKKISKFHWNFLTDGIVKSSERIAQSLEGNDSNEAKILRDAAQKIIDLTNMYSEEINKGIEAKGDSTLKKSIEKDLSQVEVMIKNNKK